MNNRYAHAAVLAANFIFAANYGIVKSISPVLIGPFGLNVARVAVSALLFWAIFLLNKTPAAGIQKQHIPRFITCAFTGIVINQTLFIKGLSLTTTLHASLLTLATPIFITLIASWLLKEGLSFIKIIGLAFGLAGAAILIMNKDHGPGGTNILLGDILVVINAISYAFYFVLVKPLMKAYSAVHVLRWIFTIGAIFIVPLGFTQFTSANWSDFKPIDWFSIAFVVIGSTFVAYLFNMFGLKRLGASATGSYVYVQPVFVALIAIVVIGEQITWMKLLAALLIFAGVYLANYKGAIKA